MKGDKGTSAGGRHGSKGADSKRAIPLGLQENTGEFRVGEDIIFGARNGNIYLRRSPQGEEVEVSESTLAGLIEDAFFTGKLDGYKTVDQQRQSA
jgi:hypothetical protein